MAIAAPALRRGEFVYGSFTPRKIPARSRLTAQLRQRLAEAVAWSNQAVSEVAAGYRVS